MRYLRAALAAAVLCASVSHAADTIQAPTRTSAYDWQCQDANGAQLSNHTRFDTAFVACYNNPAGDRIQGGTYKLPARGTSPPPPTCPAPPASTTRSQDCPAGSTGTWSQTSTSTVGDPPTCPVTTTWSPSSPPAGACNRPPTIAGTPVAAVQAGAAYSYTPTATDPDGDTLGFSIANRPTWASFDPATGRISGTPSASNVGISSSITITVSDGRASASTSAFSITVTAPAPPSPTAPTNLTGSISPNTTNPANSNVKLTWDAVAGTTMYEVWRCAGATCANFAFLADEPTAGSTNTNLPPGITYRYRVRAWQPVTGPYSAIVNIATLSATPPPPPPPAGTGTATISWTHDLKKTDGTTTLLSGFTIVYGRAPSSLTQTISVPNGAARAYTVDGLASGDWYFAVTARSPDGFESERSSVASKAVP